MRDAVTGHQANGAAVVHQARGLQTAGVVDHAALQSVQRLGRQNDQPARCLHRLFVLHQHRNVGGRDADVGQRVVTVKLQLKRFACCQRHRAQLRHDDAVVAHLRCQQGDIAAQVVGGELALIDDAAGSAIAGKGVATGHEVGIADAVRGSHQPAHINTGTWREVDAAGVGQKDLAGCVDLAEDLARVAVEHTVQGDTADTWLVEVDLRLGADVERGPVNGRAVGALVDVERGSILVDAGLTSYHLAASGQLGGRRCSGNGRIGWRCVGRCVHQRRQGHGGCQQHRPRCPFAAPLDVFSDSNPGVGEFVVNQAVAFVHDAALLRGLEDGLAKFSAAKML